jgi:hypothetical protein
MALSPGHAKSPEIKAKWAMAEARVQYSATISLYQNVVEKGNIN